MDGLGSSPSSLSDPLLRPPSKAKELPPLPFCRGLAVRAVMLSVFGGTAFVNGYGIIGFCYAVLPRYVFAVILAVYMLDVLLGGAERGRRREWTLYRTSFVTRAPFEYFGLRLLAGEEVQLKAEEQYLFAIHPHGVYPFGGLPLYSPASPLLKRFPGVRVHPCAATVCFKVPFIREYLLWTGHMDVSRSVVSKQLDKGLSMAIIPGGEAEALRTENGREAVVLEGRKGFVALALQYGVPLVPTYTFGNVDTFHISKQCCFRLRNWLQRRLKVSVPVFWGVGGTPMPLREAVSCAVGAPIVVPKNPSHTKPDEALVDEYHAKYCQALQALFEQHKAAAGYADRQLEILRAPGSGKAKGAKGGKSQ